MGPVAEIPGGSTWCSHSDVAGWRKLCCFKNKGGKNSNIDLCGYPVWEKRYLKYLYQRLTAMVDERNQSLLGSSEIRAWNDRHEGMVQVCPNRKMERKNTFLSWSWGRWEIRTMRVSRMGTEDVEYENGFSDHFLKKKSREFPKVAFSSSQCVFLPSWGRNIISVILVLPFILSLLLIWSDMLIKPRNRKHLDQEGLKNTVCYHCCGVQKTQCRQSLGRDESSKRFGGVRVRGWPQPLIINHGRLELEGTSEPPCSTPSFHR